MNKFISLALVSLAVLSNATVSRAQSAYFQAVTNLNPVAYWPLQETAQPPIADVETNLGSLGATANAYYSSTNVVKDASGIPSGDNDTAVTMQSGLNGSFLAVPTTDSRVALPAGPFTVEAWIYPTNASASTVIAKTGVAGSGGLNGSANSAGWSLNLGYIPSLGVAMPGTVSFHVYNGAGSTGGAEATFTPNGFALGNWYHVVAVFDGTNAVIYVNGVAGSSLNPMTGTQALDTWDPLTIGCGRGLNNNRFGGSLDEVAIYTNALSAARVTAHYNAGNGGGNYQSTVMSDNPYMYWRMDAPAYTTPDATTYPVANNYGTVANINGLYLSGTTPGVAGPSYSGFDSPSYACVFNGIGTDATNGIPVSNDGIIFATNVLDSGIIITNLNDSLNLTNNDETLMCWFKGNPADNRFQNLVGHGDSGFRLALGNGGTAGQVLWYFGAGGNLASKTANYNDGNWHFAVGVYQSVGPASPFGWQGTNYLYVDGLLVNSVGVTNIQNLSGLTNKTVILGGAPDYIAGGNGNGYNQRYFSGNLAHVAYFTNALTADQIGNLYVAGGGPPPLPIITEQPYPYPSVRTVTAGPGVYIFEAVVASGGTPNLGYQWYYNSSSNYAGATALVDDGVHYINSQTLQVTITNLTAGDSGYYFAVVSNDYGATTSAIVNVQVYTSPVITAQNPSGAFSLYSNQNFALTVTMVGETNDLSYQWLTNGVADTSAGNGSTYSITASVSPAVSGSTYQCIVTNDFGSATSQVATLTVLPLPASLTSSAYSSNILALNPDGYWPMHEVADATPGDVETNLGSLGNLANGYYADWSGSLTNIVHGASGALAGDGDPSVFFNNAPNGGTPGYLIIPRTSPATTLQAPFTLEAWVKPINAGFGDIISQGPWGANKTAYSGARYGIRLCWGAGGVNATATASDFQVYVGPGTGTGNPGTATPTAVLPIGQWYHIALVTADDTNWTLYVNGQQHLNFTLPMGVDTGDPIVVGQGLWQATPQRGFPGAVDEVAIYTNALDSTTIYNHYQAGITPNANPTYTQEVLATNPIVYLRMDAPAYTPPPVSAWPVLTNYGTAGINGVYSPGSMPGALSNGPNAKGISSKNVMPGNGMSSFADAGITPAFNPPPLNASFSYMAWFRGNPADPRAFQSIMSANDNTWRCSLNSAGQVQAHGEGPDVIAPPIYNSPPIYNDGNWHLMVLTCVETNTVSHSPSTNILYVDGVQVGMTTGGNTNNPAASPAPEVLLGDETGFTNNPVGPGRSLAGSVCEAAFFNGTVLTPNQVQALYSTAGVSPFIITQPVSATVNQNSAFTNTVVANGSQPLFYQWYKDNVALANQTNASLILNPVQATDAGNYYVVVTNSVDSVTSAVVSLTVETSPVITSYFPLTYTNVITLFAGANPTFSVSAVGAQPIHYYWFTNGVAIAGATNTGYTLTNAQADFSAYCVVSNFVGSTTSFVWTATVIADPVAPYPQSVLAANPIGYWRLNDPDDGSSDSSGSSDGNNGAICKDYVGGNNGIYTNTSLGYPGYNPISDPTETSAEFGESGISFYDSDAGQIAGIDFAAPTNTSATFSIEAWVNGYSQSYSGAGIVAKGYGGGGEEFALDCGAANEAFRFYVRDASGIAYDANSSIQAGPAGVWHHLVGVCDEANGLLSLYIDGALAGTASIPPRSGILASTNLMTIGSRSSTINTNNNLQFEGWINDVAIYNYALSSSQVSGQYFDAGIAPSFTQQPPSSVSVNQNGTLVVQAAATGTPPLSYHWYDVNANSYLAVQTNDTLVISNITVSDSYYLTVTNLYGTTNSTTVSVNVNSGAPVITQDLPPQVITVAGRPYTYFIGISGTEPFSYQWYDGTTPISGATNSSYTFSAVSGSYSVVITNAYNTVTSRASILTAISTPTDAYATTILGYNPAGYWPLQETNAPAPANMEANLGTLGNLGVAYYAGTNASNVSFGQGGALTATGDNDSSVGFAENNTNSFLFVPLKTSVLDLNGPFTWECWVNSTSPDFCDIIGNGGTDGDGSGNASGVRLSYNRSTSMQAYWYYGSSIGNYNSNDTGAGSITPGAWNYVVMTYDGATLDIYINGALKVSSAAAITPNHWTPLTIGTGRWDQGPTRPYGGLMDEVAVYTNVLSAMQITNHYLAGITFGSNYVQTVKNDNPLLYYRMDNVYTNPSPDTYPTAVNFGSATVNGAYVTGIMPGGVSGPPIAALGTNSVGAPINGVYSCVDANYDSVFNPTGTQPFTVMTWFRGYPWDERTQAIMGHGGNWSMNIDNVTGRIVWNLYTGGQVVSTNVLNDGNWHQVAGVYDGATSYLYVDGALNNSGVAGSLTGETNADVFLGGNADYTFEQYAWGARYFAGAIAQAAFFTNALTATQIQQIYGAAAPGLPTISLAPSGSHLMITYTGTLLSSTNVVGPYTPVAGAISPYLVTPSGAQVFYRTSKP